MKFKAVALGMLISGYAFSLNPSLKLTNDMIDTLKSRVSTQYETHQALAVTEKRPKAKQLGMNGVPVFKQESIEWDTIYAATGAFDALIGKGDYISQVCLKALGNYMGSDDSTEPFLRTYLARLENYGYQSKENEAKCLNNDTISFEEYHVDSDVLLAKFLVWLPILDFHKALFERVDTGETLSTIQNIISSGRRITVGFFVPVFDNDMIGTIGSYHAKKDTWIMTPRIERELGKVDMYIHHAIITGYDDNATVVDDEGKKHKGLLTLRDSLGTDVGDNGDFYMTYDYFRVLVIEAQQVLHLTSPDDSENDNLREVFP